MTERTIKIKQLIHDEVCMGTYGLVEKELLEMEKEIVPIDKDRMRHMRQQATNVFELTKGFTGEPTDNAMKAALEMAGYVLELTNEKQ